MSTIKKVISVFGSLFLSLIFITPFCIFWDYKNVDVTCEDGSTETKSMPNKYVINSLEGFGINKSDEYGYYNLTNTNNRDIDILIMGSSNIEGLHVMQSDTLYARLNEYIPEYYTYSIGKSGHYLPTIVGNLEDAIESYKPNNYLIIEVFPDHISESELRRMLTEDNAIVEVTDSEIKSRINKYFPQIMSLNTSRYMWLRKTSESENNIPEVSKDCVEDLVLYLKSLENGFRFILFNHPNLNFDSNGNINTSNSNYMSNLKTLCELNDIYFVEMSEVFESDYHKNYGYAHGFINTRVDSGHLNARGLDLIAQEIIKVIEKDNELN